MRRLLSILCIVLLVSGCSTRDEIELTKPEVNSVYYEIFVGSFRDSDGDGIGDIQGVIDSLDYIQNDLGATAIWLTPINPSTTYHKYDVMDYKAIDPEFGTMEDFDALVAQMNERGMDLILDLVLNHSSSRHPWFLEAVSAQLNGTCDETPECDFYHFSKNSQRGYAKASTDLYYEAVFWDQMPDLNLDNTLLRDEITDITKFWLDKGVKGFRLDATTHFYDENVALNTGFLLWFNSMVKSQRQDAYLVGEAWTSNTLVNQMYASGVDSFFNFDFSQQDGTIVKSIQNGQGSRLAELVQKYHDTIKGISNSALEATFISNHDNNRSAGYLSAKENYQRMVASVYLLMPGNVFIYYGEEIGMRGSGVDENKRLPMVWSTSDDTGIPNAPKNASQQNSIESGVKEQLKDSDSLLSHYQRVIRIRNLFPDIARGRVEAMDTGIATIYAINCGDVVVMHNFSDDAQTVSLKNIESVTRVDGKETHNSDGITLEGWSSVIITLHK